MSEEPYISPGIQPDESIPAPPPRRRARRKSKRQLVIESEYKKKYEAELARAQTQLDKQLGIEHQMHRPMPPPAPPNALPAVLTLADIQAAKAIIAQAEAALGVAKVKTEAPAPTHPPQIEDPAQGDKTPAVVEWYQKNDPEEYRRRYCGRKTHIEDRRKERPYEPLAAVVSMPADPDGKFMVAGRETDLSKTDHSGGSPRVL